MGELRLSQRHCALVPENGRSWCVLKSGRLLDHDDLIGVPGGKLAKDLLAQAHPETRQRRDNDQRFYLVTRRGTVSELPVFVEGADGLDVLESKLYLRNVLELLIVAQVHP